MMQSFFFSTRATAERVTKCAFGIEIFGASSKLELISIISPKSWCQPCRVCRFLMSLCTFIAVTHTSQKEESSHVFGDSGNSFSFCFLGCSKATYIHGFSPLNFVWVYARPH